LLFIVLVSVSADTCCAITWLDPAHIKGLWHQPVAAQHADLAELNHLASLAALSNLRRLALRGLSLEAGE
jgi:hypothetical protein